MPILFDTQRYVATVKAGGVGDREAQAMSDALKDALNEGVATNQGLLQVGARIDVLSERVDGLGKTIEAVAKGLNDKIEGGLGGLNDKSDRGLGGLNDKIDRGVDGLNDKIDIGLGVLNDKIDRGLGGLNDKIDIGLSALNDKIDRGLGGLNDKIEGVRGVLSDKIEGGLSALNDKIEGVDKGVRAELAASFNVLKIWLMVLTAMIALSNPLIMQFYKTIGWLH